MRSSAWRPASRSALILLVAMATLAACRGGTGAAPSASASPSPAPTATPTPSPTPSPSPTPFPSPPGLAAGEIGYSCGGAPPAFPSSALGGPVGAENATDPAAVALRTFVQTDELMPDTEWRLVYRSEMFAIFVHDGLSPDFPYLGVEMELAADGWRPVRWGDCTPRAVLEGLGPGIWRLAPWFTPAFESTELQVLVLELQCASGAAPDGRVPPPHIVYAPDAITITIGVVPREGAQTCPGNPEYGMTITLAEPVAGRALLDGGVFPPRDARTCEFPC